MDEAAMEARRKSAWNEVREFWGRLQRQEATRDQDPQLQFAPEFFAYFRDSPDTDIGRKALATAFMMWGNTGSAETVRDALPQLDLSSDYWETVLHGVVNAYYRAGRSGEAIDLLHRYDAQLTHPASQSSLWLHLGRHYLGAGDAERAEEYYERILILNARPRDVQEARGSLYEIRSLAFGQPAPQFEALSIDGATLRLADCLGIVVCLDFWDSSCGPCWAEFPTLRDMHTEFSGTDFQLVGICSDREEHALRAVMEKEQLSWPQIREEVGWDGEQAVFGPLRRLYNVWGVPRTILIDRGGRIAAKDLRGLNLVNAVRALVHPRQRGDD